LDDDKKKAPADDKAEEPEEAASEPVEEPKEEPAEEPEEPAESAAPAGGAPAPASGSTDKFGRTLYDATCSQCGKTAQVPFQPSSDRPVYCQDCYRARKPQKDFGGGGRFGGK